MNEIEQLKKEIEELKKKIAGFKDSNILRQEVLAQQTNSRDPFRSDRGEIVLKKNSNIKSRKALVEGYENVLSMSFNDSASGGAKNIIYIGHDGGNGQRNTEQLVIGTTDALSIRVFDKDQQKELQEGEEMKSAILIGERFGDENMAILSATPNGISAIGNYFETLGDRANYFTAFSSRAMQPYIESITGKPLVTQVYNPNDLLTPTTSGTAVTGNYGGVSVINGLVTGAAGGGYSGIIDLSTASTITVSNGIITNVT